MELTFFSTQITNLLVARRTAEDQYIGINAGVSSHIGMEFLLNYQLLQTSQFNYQAIFRLRSIASHLKTLLMGTIIILEINSGVPDAQWNVGLDASSTSGFILLLVK
jgi:iron complex outermembrane receptor protein